MRSPIIGFERLMGVCYGLLALVFAGCAVPPFWAAALAVTRRSVEGIISFVFLGCGFLFVAWLFKSQMDEALCAADAIAEGRPPLREIQSGPLIAGSVIPAVLALAFLGMQQKFIVIERARLSEAQTLASDIRKAEERYLARNGTYAIDDFGLKNNLDIAFWEGPPRFGMHDFLLSVSRGSTTCDKGYRLVFQRCDGDKTAGCLSGASQVARLWGPYRLIYDRCLDRSWFENCTRCANDLLN